MDTAEATTCRVFSGLRVTFEAKMACGEILPEPAEDQCSMP